MIRYFFLLSLSLLFWGLHSSPGRAELTLDNIEPVELSLSTMILFAMDNNPDVLIALEKYKQLGFFVDEAKSDYYPQIELQLQGGREYITPTGGANTNNVGKSTLNLNQKIFDGFVTTSEIERRKNLEDSAHYDLDIEKENLILQVVEFYLDILRYQDEVKSSEKFVTEIDSIVGTISDLYEAGAIGKAMLDYAQSRQAAAYVDYNEAKSSLNDGISNLEFLTGPLPPFKAIPPDQFNANNIDKKIYIDNMSEENVFLQKNEVEITAMQNQLKIEKGGYYPSVDFVMKAEQTHDDGGDIGRGRNLKGTINMTLDLFDGFNKQSRVKRVSSQIKELEYRDDKLYKELKKDINLAYNQLLAIRESIRVTNQEIRSNRALQSLNRENFKLGSINVIELIEGEERLNDAYARKYQLQQEMYQNTYSLLLSSAMIEEEFFCETCDFAKANVEK